MKQLLVSITLLFPMFSPAARSALSQEPTREDAERRLPPVVDSVDLPDRLLPGRSYNVSWTVMAYYDEGLDSICALFFNEETIQVQETDTDTAITDGRYRWGDIRSYQFDFAGSFAVPPDATPQDFTVRFYSRPHGSSVGYKQAYLSSIIPGGVDARPYEAEGRKLRRSVVPSTFYSVETANFAGNDKNSFFFLRISTNEPSQTISRLRVTIDFTGQRIKTIMAAELVRPPTIATFLIDLVGITPAGIAVSIADLLMDLESFQSEGLSLITADVSAEEVGGVEFFVWTEGSEPLSRLTATVEAFDTFGNAQGLIDSPFQIGLIPGPFHD